MNRYKGKIKVVCDGQACFPADPLTYDELGDIEFDPRPLQPEPDAYGVISVHRWLDARRRIARGLIVPDAAGARL